MSTRALAIEEDGSSVITFPRELYDVAVTKACLRAVAPLCKNVKNRDALGVLGVTESDGGHAFS